MYAAIVEDHGAVQKEDLTAVPIDTVITVRFGLLLGFDGIRIPLYFSGSMAASVSLRVPVGECANTVRSFRPKIDRKAELEKSVNAAEEINSMKLFKKGVSILLLLLLLAGSMVGCRADEEIEFRTMEDFERARIGVLTGSSFDLLAKEHFPQAERVYLMNVTDLIVNLEQGKIDGILMDMAFFTPLRWENKGLSYIEMDMPAVNYAVAFPKTAEAEPLKAQMNEFIKAQTQNGRLDELEEKWFGKSEPDSSPDMSGLTGENGTLRVATTVDSKPFDYLKNGALSGFDADFIYDFAEEYGYALEIDTMDFGALLPSLNMGKYDLAISSITVTEERKESVAFSDIYCSSPIVMAVEDADAGKALTVEDICELTTGVIVGSSWDLVVQKEFPNAERKYFTSYADVILALKQGKVDTFITDKTMYVGMRWENSDVFCIDEPIQEIHNALILAKDGCDEKLLSQINDFVAKSKENGTLAILGEKWFADAEPAEHPDYSGLTGENGTLKIAVGNAMKPAAYQRGSAYTGYEVDFLTMFAEEYGYKLEIEGMTTEALIPAVSSGKFDIGASGLTITPERSESVTFADSHFTTYGVAVLADTSADTGTRQVRTLTDLEGEKVAVLTGTLWDGVAKEELPNTEVMHFATTSDLLLALEQEKVLGVVGPRTFYAAAGWENVPVRIIAETEASIFSGFMLAKEKYDQNLLDQLNAFIEKAKQDGTVDALSEKWLSDKEPAEHPDYQSLSGENGILRVAVDNTAKPMVYRRNDAFTGFDVDLLTKFAEAYGYALAFEGMSFDALIPYVSTGKCDMGACGIAITPERAESVTFTDSYIELAGVVMVSTDAVVTDRETFFDDISDGFEKTFIREDRWKLLVEGIGVTLLISLCAAVCGTGMGFGLYMLTRSDKRLIRSMANGFAKVYSRIVAGTPVVVILMILFYVVFGRVRDMSGIVVAVIGFTLTFGAFVHDHMRVSVSSVDPGQTEAAHALGYTKNKAFFRVVFPQAMKIFLPSYCGHTVELIKATAVVGYIAVNDLTKMGDIIRSNTYEAFFPLIATAVIYFLMTWIVSWLLGFVRICFEPKRRSNEEVLKGVKIKRHTVSD